MGNSQPGGTGARDAARKSDPSIEDQSGIRNIIDPMAFDALSPEDKGMLRMHFTLGSMQRFAAKQREAIQQDAASLDPFTMGEAQFHNTAKNYRLIWRFWADLEGFMTDMAHQPDRTYGS